MEKVFDLIEIDKGLMIGKTHHSVDDNYRFNTGKANLYIQFHFVLEECVQFKILGGTYKLQVKSGESLFFFNPKNIIPIHVSIRPKIKMLSLLFSLDAFHEIIDDEAVDFNFLNPKNIKKKLYEKRELDIPLKMIIQQIFQRKIETKFDVLFIKAKILEFLSFYFNKKETAETHCKNLENTEVIEKIKKAKKIMIAQIDEPPLVEELAHQVNLPINVFKKTFKAYYGMPVYKYLLNYKLDLSKQLLLSGDYSVKEVAFQLGYSAPTHFIVAFKNKFGITPRKFMKNL